MKLLGLGDNVFDAYLFRDELYPGGNAANVSVLARRIGAEYTGYLGVLKVIKEVAAIENSKCWTFSISVGGESKDAARILDPLNRQVCEKYKPTVLTNECSAYFNKALYPTVNEFERKLRKLLYLASSLRGDEKSQNVIVRLEEQDLGTIFEMLFSDAIFVKKAKETVTKTLSWQFTRAELLDALNKLDENKLWTVLLGDDCAKTLCESFSELRNYRNDVMHAHDIGYERFNAAQKLFKKVNNELDLAIGKLIGAKEANTDVTPADFNSTLSSALAAVHSQVDTSSLLAASEALKGIVSNQPIINPEVSKSLSQIGRLAMGEYTLKPEVTAAIANLSKIAAVQSDMAPAMRAINDIAKQIASYKIEIPPAVTELQQRLSEIEFGLLSNSSDAQQDNEEDKTNG